VRTPAPGELLDAWDLGAVLPPVERVSPLLRAATGLGPEELAALGVGERDRMLVALRERLFGGTLRTVVDCPACGVPLEVVLPTSALLAAGSGPETVEVDLDGYRLRCRAPRSGDLAAAAGTGSAAGARALLVERAVVSAERDGEALTLPDLPDRVIAAAAATLAEAHPLVDVELPIACDACGVSWSCPFDIGRYLWEELDAWAVRVLSEVHVLATAYGWSEADILALTPTRRRRYLELAGHG
jgi:hypothetical protein